MTPLALNNWALAPKIASILFHSFTEFTCYIYFSEKTVSRVSDIGHVHGNNSSRLFSFPIIVYIEK